MCFFVSISDFLPCANAHQSKKITFSFSILIVFIISFVNFSQPILE
ncbi:hypothetical protein GW891_05360 [bacterium]|nr:hypothetical protein [bacterium]